MTELLRLLVGAGAAALDPFLLIPAAVLGWTRKGWLEALLFGFGFGIAYAIAVSAVFEQWSHPNLERIMAARLVACTLVTLAAYGLKRFLRKRTA